MDEFDWYPTEELPPEAIEFGEQPNGIPSPFKDNGELDDDFLDQFDLPQDYPDVDC